MSRSCADLPTDVKGLFPKENLDFAAGITAEEATVLKEVFAEHDCFHRVGEMIDAVRERNPTLADKMKAVLDKNCARLEGLSPAAVEHSKKIIHFVTEVQCGMTLEKDVCHKEVAEIRKAFQELSAADQEALKKNNPDITF